MAGSLNKACLLGNLGMDPEIRRLASGSQVANLRLATSESWRDKQSGERREKTEWHTVVIWNENLVKVAEQYLSKGSKVYVEGKIITRKWQDQSGADRYSTEIHLENYNGTLILLSPRAQDEDDDRGDRRSSGSGSSRQTEQRRPAQQDMDDEIPF